MISLLSTEHHMLLLHTFRSLLPGTVLFLFLFTACGTSSGDLATETTTVPNGIYAVLGEDAHAETVLADHSTALILPYDGRYTGDGPMDTPVYVALDTTEFVPLIIEGEPQRQKDDRNHTALNVTLDRRYVSALEHFTAARINERAAIVIGGEVVTMHRIRAAISGGRLMITRCDDNACEVLYTRLTEK
jgi:hypothetical protein